MFIRQHHTRTRLLQLADGLLFSLAATLAYTLRSYFPLLNLPDLEAFADYLWLLLIMGLTGPCLLAQQGFYRPAPLQSRGAAVFTIMRGCAYTVLALVLFLFVLRMQLARSVIILGGTFAALLVYARHELTQRLSAGRVAESELRRRALWVGPAAAITRLQAALTPMEQAILSTAATLDPTLDEVSTTLPRLLHEHAVNIVLLDLPSLDPVAANTVIAACECEGIELVLYPGLPVATPVNLTVEHIGGEPVLYYRAHPASPGALAFKQLLDYLGAGILLLLLAPVFLITALLVRISSAGPILYRQQRAGLNGRPFTMYKFRSMRADADAIKPSLAARNEMDGPVFKITADPRVTPIGRILRRHSLDELPQLWNVLRGEMSLVGPRPLPLDEVSRFRDISHRRRLSVKPGLTCLWQVRGRNDISSFEEWVRLDLEYIDQWSLWLDVKILLATIPVTLFGRGGR